jgi:flagellar biosynthesis protein FliR
MIGFEDYVVAAVLTFCRVGLIVGLLPGISSARIPMRIRIWLGVAVSLFLVPVTDWQNVLVEKRHDSEIVALALREVVVGLGVGMTLRMISYVVEFFASAASSLIGLTGLPGVVLEDFDNASALTPLLSAVGALFFFAADLHHVVISGVLGTYALFPPSRPFEMGILLPDVTQSVQSGFVIALQCLAPILLFSVTVNFAFGLLGRWTPQIQSYFVAIAMTILGGVAILAQSASHIGVNLVNWSAEVIQIVTVSHGQQ